MIKIANIRTFKPDDSQPFRVDRTSALGNPYFMKDETMRDEVCDKYETWFHKELVRPVRNQFHTELAMLRAMAKTGTDITLLCWCYPKRCHAETIKRYLEEL